MSTRTRVRYTTGRKIRSGITLVELMISVVLSLIILSVMVGAFRFSSEQIRQGRATLELAAQLRAAGETLRRDLDNITVPLRPQSIDSSAHGYFEYIEGPNRDKWENIIDENGNFEPRVPITDPRFDPNPNSPLPSPSYLGDHDDVLAMTVRSEGRPFRGRWVDPVTGDTETVESYVAEIIWWTIHQDGPPPLPADGVVQYSENITLYRRVLLIRPDLTTAFNNMTDYFAENDVSARPVQGGIVMNSLADLTKRENRFSHNAGAYPFPMMRNWLNDRNLQGLRQGEDIMLTNVTAFDVKVFSPNAPVQYVADQVIDPGDPGFDLTLTEPSFFEGAFVDLGYADMEGLPAGNLIFAGPPHELSGLLNSVVPNNDGVNVPIREFLGYTWCTWSPHYEAFGDAADGIDRSGEGGPDSMDERETMPPYGHPIRALQVTFRAIEKGTGQSRQLTIQHSFVPE